nr:ATP-binding protein [Acuticoccus mangrovi]
MRRFLPQSLMGQFALLLAGAIIVANLVAILLLNAERVRMVREARRGAQVERVAALASALSEVPPEQRDKIADAVDTPWLRVSVDDTPAVTTPGRDRFARRVTAMFEDALGEGDVGVRVSLVGEDDDAGDPRHEGRRRDRRGPPDRHGPRLIASLPLSGGEWLNVRPQPPGGPPLLVSRAVLFALVLSLVSVLGVGLWFIRRLTRPLAALGVAAERAGYGDRDARVPVTGAREVRRAAEAFNNMQERIAAFDAERARTIAAVGHDLRTPITSLRIRAEMLEDGEREAMVRTLDEMRVMAEGLLEWGRIGAETEKAEAVDLADVLAGLADETVRYEGPDTFVIEGRRVALSRAFGNLTGNARRYAGGAVVRLVPERDHVVVTVEDTGPGIPEERLEEVFEPFRRLEESRSEDTGGVGLGLSITRAIVQAHGGTASLANRPPHGLIATVTLPRHRPRRRRAGPSAAAE